jgi:hypothetical protein
MRSLSITSNHLGFIIAWFFVAGLSTPPHLRGWCGLAFHQGLPHVRIAVHAFFGTAAAICKRPAIERRTTTFMIVLVLADSSFSSLRQGGNSTAKNRKRRQAMAIVRLPELEQSKSAVLNSPKSPSSQRSDDHAIRNFIDWYCSEPQLACNKTVVKRYASSSAHKLK